MGLKIRQFSLLLSSSGILKFIYQSVSYSNISNSSLKMIPDFKQQISELEKQKRDLEIRLNEQTETMKGNWNPHEPAFRKWFPVGGKGG